jgi:hypothetical protein
MLDTWRNVLLRPGEEVFIEEKARPNGTLTIGLIWIVIAALVASVLGWVQGMIFASSLGGMAQFFEGMDLPPEAQAQLSTLLNSGMFGAASLWSIVVIPIGFLIVVGITHLLATLLRGSGDYGKMGYLRATYQAPILIIGAVLGFVPFLGGCIYSLLWIYSFVLSYYAVKVNYDLTSGQAIAVVLIPLALGLLLLMCFGIAAMSLLIPLLDSL